jgi:hypothetical protein
MQVSVKCSVQQEEPFNEEYAKAHVQDKTDKQMRRHMHITGTIPGIGAVMHTGT